MYHRSTLEVVAAAAVWLRLTATSEGSEAKRKRERTRAADFGHGKVPTQPARNTASAVSNINTQLVCPINGSGSGGGKPQFNSPRPSNFTHR